MRKIQNYETTDLSIKHIVIANRNREHDHLVLKQVTTIVNQGSRGIWFLKNKPNAEKQIQEKQYCKS